MQVFKFLEEVHGRMDALAEKHSIFKVQTVGDMYVAASGLPKPRSDHALCMARFAIGKSYRLPGMKFVSQHSNHLAPKLV